MDEIKFKKGFRGYKQGEVDRFIQKLTSEYQKGYNENVHLQEQNNKLIRQSAEQAQNISHWQNAYEQLKRELRTHNENNENLKALISQKNAMGEALAQAEITSASKIAAAHAEAEQIIGKARREAARIKDSANLEQAETVAARDRLVKDFEASLNKILGESAALLGTSNIFHLHQTSGLDLTND